MLTKKSVQTGVHIH